MTDIPSSSLESQRQQTAQKESERVREMLEIRELTRAIILRLKLPNEKEAYRLAKAGSCTLIDDILIQKYFQSGTGNDPEYIGKMLYEAYLADGTQHIYPDSYDVYNEEDEDEDDNTSTKINSRERALLEELIPDFMTSLEIEKQEEKENKEKELADKAKRAAKRELGGLISDRKKMS